MNKALYAKAVKYLSTRLIAAREEAQLELADAAKKINCTQAFIERAEAGEEKIDAIILKELADLYKKDMAFFFLPESKKPAPAKNRGSKKKKFLLALLPKRKPGK